MHYGYLSLRAQFLSVASRTLDLLAPQHGSERNKNLFARRAYVTLISELAHRACIAIRVIGRGGTTS